MKIAIIGYGKMGKTIEKLAIDKGHEIVLRISRNNQHDLNSQNISLADVAIEFSVPEIAFQNISFCLKSNTPVVCGTTGWLDKMSEVKKLCTQNEGAFFYASNYSIGVNILFALNRFLASLMKEQPQYDVSMEEIHHTQKLDHPSGTAITLAEDIIDISERKQSWSGILEGQDENNGNDGVLKIISKRVGEVPASYFIKWSSVVDQIEINHIAHSRKGFAAGALSAAEWLIGKKGCFGMDDMLGLPK